MYLLQMNWALTFSQYYVHKLPTNRVFNLPTHFRSTIVLPTYAVKKADYTYIYTWCTLFLCLIFFLVSFLSNTERDLRIFMAPVPTKWYGAHCALKYEKSAIILMKFRLARINMYDVIIFFFEAEERPFFCGIITQLLIPIIVFLILHYFSIFLTNVWRPLIWYID